MDNSVVDIVKDLIKHPEDDLSYLEDKLLIREEFSEAELQDLKSALHPKTMLCIALDITLPSEFIKTMSIAEWKRFQSDFHRPRFAAMSSGSAVYLSSLEPRHRRPDDKQQRGPRPALNHQSDTAAAVLGL